jgi:hypothetical protein
MNCLANVHFCATVLLSSNFLKITGSAAAVAGTVSVDSGEGLDKKSAITFFKPGK